MLEIVWVSASDTGCLTSACLCEGRWRLPRQGERPWTAFFWVPPGCGSPGRLRVVRPATGRRATRTPRDAAVPGTGAVSAVPQPAARTPRGRCSPGLRTKRRMGRETGLGHTGGSRRRARSARGVRGGSDAKDGRATRPPPVARSLGAQARAGWKGDQLPSRTTGPHLIPFAPHHFHAKSRAGLGWISTSSRPRSSARWSVPSICLWACSQSI
ncbi:uncharacterized protein LOC135228298 [Loxodonta africana]|uniref:uncharacterized protein LOC135228298 n=1 Tax=Loxodonta africana TaxID=9785 RepID=UPI0030D267B8